MRAETQDRDTVDALRSAFIHAPTPMAVIEQDGTVREANSELRALLDLGAVDADPVRLADLAPPEDHHLLDGVLTEIAVGGRARVECRLRRRDGSEGVVELAVSAVTSADHASPFAIAQVNDITAQRDTEEKLLHQTLHDPLTGLGNRLLLRDRLERAVAQRHQSPVALMFIDLDHFKWTNDTHGHEVGDELLVEVARRLRHVVRGDDTVVRLGGDEFVILATRVGRRGRRRRPGATRCGPPSPSPSASRPHTLTVTASVGVVLAGAEHTTADALLRDADLAMYRAKSLRARPPRDHRGQPAGTERRLRPGALRLALDTDSLLPAPPARDRPAHRAGHGHRGPAAGAGPHLGHHPPGPGPRRRDRPRAARRPGRVGPRPGARARCTEWDDAGIGPLSVFLNLSGAELDSDSLLERVSAALTATSPRADRIHLEVPEPALLLADGAALDRLRTLAALGVRLGIDDFGTGSTSLAHLRSLPVHFLKIDPSIGRRLREPGGRAVVEAVVAVGRALGLDVIAEGIEEQAQMEVLAQLGCTHAQGHLFGVPTPAEALALPSTT